MPLDSKKVCAKDNKLKFIIKLVNKEKFKETVSPIKKRKYKKTVQIFLNQ